MFKQKAITALMLLFLSSMLLFTSCSKDDDDASDNTPTTADINAIDSPIGSTFIASTNGSGICFSAFDFNAARCYINLSTTSAICTYEYTKKDNFNGKLSLSYNLSGTIYTKAYYLTFTDNRNGEFVSEIKVSNGNSSYKYYEMGKFKFFTE